MKRLCVFTNDPLLSIYKKGSIKPRYFNPKNLFDEIHIVSLFDEDIEKEKVKEIAGSAFLKIHVAGKVNLLNKNFKKKKIINLVKKIQPNVIRSFNPLLQGWMAAQVKKELGIPLVISLHADMDRDTRYFAKKYRNYKKYFKLLYAKKILEFFAIRNADEVIIIYEFLRDYAKKMGARNINLIYNKVELKQFSPDIKPAFSEKIPVVICVGRLIKEKNQECLIRAIKDLNVKLLLIGNGKEYVNLKNLVKKFDIEHKVQFETSIPNHKIQNYYTSADVFALPIKFGGIPIPAFEAAASGIPVILPKKRYEHSPDLVEDFALLVENNPESFKNAILKVVHNKEIQTNMIKKGLEVSHRVSSDLMEEKEKQVYLKLLDKN